MQHISFQIWDAASEIPFKQNTSTVAVFHLNTSTGPVFFQIFRIKDVVFLVKSINYINYHVSCQTIIFHNISPTFPFSWNKAICMEIPLHSTLPIRGLVNAPPMVQAHTLELPIIHNIPWSHTKETATKKINIHNHLICLKQGNLGTLNKKSWTWFRWFRKRSFTWFKWMKFVHHPFPNGIHRALEHCQFQVLSGDHPIYPKGCTLGKLMKIPLSIPFYLAFFQPIPCLHGRFLSFFVVCVEENQGYVGWPSKLC